MKRVYVLSLTVLYSFTTCYAALHDQKSSKSREQEIFRRELGLWSCVNGEQSGWKGSTLERSRSAENLLKAFPLSSGQCVAYAPEWSRHKFVVQTCIGGPYHRQITIAELRSLAESLQGVSCSDGGIGRRLQEFYLAEIGAVVKPHDKERDKAAAALLASLRIADNKENRDKVIQFSVAQGLLPDIYKP